MNKTIWIVIADSAHARFFSIGHRPMHLVEAHPDVTGPSHEHVRGIVSDRAGRTFNSAPGKARHGLESRHDPKKMEKHNFIVTLVDVLDNAARSGAFDALVLVAPKRSLGELRPLLSEGIRNRIIAEIPKDLMKHSSAELLKHLEPVLNREAVGLPPSTQRNDG